MWRSTNFRPPSKVQQDAIKVLGSRLVVKDGLTAIEPAYGLDVLRAVVLSSRDAEVGVMQRLLRDMGVQGPGADILFKNKKIVRDSDGEAERLRIVPDIPGLADDNLSLYSATDDGVDEGEIYEQRALTYQLSSVFNDSTLQDKLRLSSRSIQRIKRLAARDPARAARSATDLIQARGFPKCSVLSGDYSKSVSRAKSVIHQLADTIEYKDAAIPSTVFASKLQLTYDGFDGVKQWSVQAPLKYAIEAQCIYQLVIHYGADHVLFMLGVETAMLSIEIYNEIRREYYSGMLLGYSSIAGISPGVVEYPRELTADQKSRLVMASAKVMPVTCDTKTIGSAVRVSDRHVLVNTHTLNTAIDVGALAVVDGQDVTASRSVAFDLSVLDRGGGSAQWSLRDPVVGEKVILAFSVGDKVEYTEVLRVWMVAQDQLVLSPSNILRHGASGAVVIALKDFAMLGMFSSIRGNDVLCSTFSNRHFTQVAESASVTSVEQVDDGIDIGGATYDRMLRRGLGTYLEAINKAIAPIYVKVSNEYKLVGTVAYMQGHWYTTVNPNYSQLYLASKQPLLFETAARGYFRCVDPPPILEEVPNVRTIIPGERVCVIARDGNDVIMSQIVRIEHYAYGATHFSIEGIDTSEILAGGLVISERDSAVLGQFVDVRDDSFGEQQGYCVCAIGVATDSEHRVSSPLVDPLCVGLLTGDLEPYAVNESYYRAISDNAYNITVLQHRHDKGLAIESYPKFTQLNDASVRRFVNWYTDYWNISNVKLDSYTNLLDRLPWLLGYLYSEYYTDYEKAFNILYNGEDGLTVNTTHALRVTTDMRTPTATAMVSPLSVDSPAVIEELQDLRKQVANLSQELRLSNQKLLPQT